MSPDPAALDRLVAEALGGDGDRAARRWAACGAMALTGPVDGPPDLGPARIALAMDALAADIAATSGRVGTAVTVDGAALLSERAAIAGLHRQGATSCGGATRLLRAADDSAVALSLARDDDRELLPAMWSLLGDDDALDVREAMTADQVWVAVAARASLAPGAAFVAAAVELGLPAARQAEAAASALVEWTDRGAARPRRDRPVVVDLSSLWAGPLCAHLLGLAGARVVKVESTRRPDGARSGPAPFFDLLHGGHESVGIDLATGEGRTALRQLLTTADVVIEASRPRALAGLGAAYDDLVAAGWAGTWLSITGHGRNGPAAERVAFGDDAAVAGGLVGSSAAGGRSSRAVWFVGDAIADPATGLVAAAAVLRALASGRRGLIAVALATTAAHLASGVGGHPRPTAPAGLEVAPPTARRVTTRAPRLGEHDAVWLG